MAEIAFGVVGVVGLAGLFSACIDCIDKFEIGRAQSGTLSILATKLDNQKLLFSIWGQSVGLYTEGESDRPIDCISKPIRAKIARTMTEIQQLFQESQELEKRYSLVVDAAATASPRAVSRPQHLVGYNTDKSRPQDKRQHITRWIIKDEARFKELVKDFRELVEDLENLTRTPETLARRDKVLRQSLKEWPRDRLQAAEEAGQDDDRDDVSIISADVLDQRTLTSKPGNSLQRSIITGQTGDVCCIEYWIPRPDRLTILIAVCANNEFKGQQVTIKDLRFVLKLHTSRDFTREDLLDMKTKPPTSIEWPRFAIVGQYADRVHSKEQGTWYKLQIILKCKKPIRSGSFKPSYSGVVTPAGFRSYCAGKDDKSSVKLPIGPRLASAVEDCANLLQLKISD
ncbi:MAG: hypothetical protein Q9201_000427 [Fulgogasparrea decipioides]